jgi:hypothetical protein
LREPPVSGARRLPALHCGSSPRLSTATAPNRAHPHRLDAGARLDSLVLYNRNRDKCQGKLCRPASRRHHSPTVRTTLDVGRALTALPPNSFMIAASYSGSVVTSSSALTYTIL